MLTPKPVLKMLLLAAAGLLLPLSGFWFVATQPLFSSEPHSVSVTVDPARLEGHVRMLSETFSPRDWAHPHNLERAAAYIKTEIEKAGGTVAEQAYQMEGNTYRNVI